MFVVKKIHKKEKKRHEHCAKIYIKIAHLSRLVGRCLDGFKKRERKEEKKASSGSCPENFVQKTVEVSVVCPKGPFIN